MPSIWEMIRRSLGLGTHLIESHICHAGPASPSEDDVEQQYRRQKALAAEKRDEAAKHARPLVRCPHILPQRVFVRSQLSSCCTLMEADVGCSGNSLAHLAELSILRESSLWLKVKLLLQACLIESDMHDSSNTDQHIEVIALGRAESLSHGGQRQHLN